MEEKTFTKVVALISGILLAVILIVPSVLVPTGCGGSGLEVALTVTEAAGKQRSAEPVTAGVPISRASGVYSTDNLRVTDAGGTEVPAQFTVTERWGGSTGDGSLPIRWVLMDFQATVGGGSTSTYYLRDGGQGDATGTGLSVVRDDSSCLEIETGAARFRLNKGGFNLFDSVRVGGQELVSPGATTGAAVRDTDGGTYFSGSEAPSEVALELDGSMRKMVKIGGEVKSGSGTLLSYTARLHFFAGKSTVKVQFAFENKRDPVISEEDGQPQCRDIGSPRSAVFEDGSLVLSPDTGGGSGYRLATLEGLEQEGDLTQLVKIYQDSSGTDYWNRHAGSEPRPQSYVSFRGFRVYRGSAETASGDQASPWMDVSGSKGGITVGVRDFWQNFPKALRADSDSLEVALFPAEYGGEFSFRPQEQKTHEVLYYFHGPGASDNDVDSVMTGCYQPLFAAATAEHYVGSGALGRVATVGDFEDFSNYETQNRNTIEEGSGSNLFRAIDEADFYSWEDFGDVPLDYEDGGTGQMNLKYNFDYGMLVQFMRGGGTGWFGLGERGGRHLADIDVLHYQGEVDYWSKGGYFGHSYHDEDGNLNPNRNYGAPHPDLVFGAPGLFLLYNLTGYPFALDTAIEISENIKYRYDNSFGRGNGEGWAGGYDDETGGELPRPFANGLRVLVAACSHTGDTRYLDTAEWLIENSHDATDKFITPPVPGDTRGVKLFSWDMLACSLGRYLDLLAERGEDDGMGVTDYLLDMAEQEATHMWGTDSAGNQGVPYQWLIDGTAMGWEGSEVPVNVCNWQLQTADTLAYGYIYGGSDDLLAKAAEAYKTGSDYPAGTDMGLEYTATKEAVNAATCGLVYMSTEDRGPVTGGQFQEWICIQNPGGEVAEIELIFQLWGQGERRSNLTMEPRTRATINPSELVGLGKDVSTEVRSDKNVLVERPIYFNYHSQWLGGHNDAGVLSTSREWYFAEGTTREGFEQWLCIQNPGEEDADVTLEYLYMDGAGSTHNVPVSAHSRTTVSVNEQVEGEQDVSTVVTSNTPIVVERPMYFNYHGALQGGHDVAGAVETHSRYYFAEGTTRDGFESWLCIGNPSTEDMVVHATFMMPAGDDRYIPLEVPASSRKTFELNGILGPGIDFSMMLDAEWGFLAERPMYFTYNGMWSGGHDAKGTPSPSKVWFLPEGTTRPEFQEYICILNPTPVEAHTTIEYMTRDGVEGIQAVIVPPTSRATVDVNSFLGPWKDVSAQVTSNVEIVVERPLYFAFHNECPGGHVVMGLTTPSTHWFLAEGTTR